MSSGKLEVRGPTMAPLPEDAFIQAADLYVGQTIQLVQQNFFIYDADPFTRRFFKDELGIDLASKIDVRLPERTIPRPATPPYTGYGSWDDSMGSVLSLVPKVPRKNFQKLFYNDGKVRPLAPPPPLLSDPRWYGKTARGKRENGARAYLMWGE